MTRLEEEALVDVEDAIPNLRERQKGQQANLTPLEEEDSVSAEDHICDIIEEVKDLEEIKDILDELRMIQRVLDDQATVLWEYTKHQQSMIRFQGNNERSILRSRREKVRRLYGEAESVEASVCSQNMFGSLVFSL